METTTTEALVQQAQRGDEASLDALVQRCSKHIARRVTGNAGAAIRREVEIDDLVQESLTCVVDALSGFEWRNERSFHAWLNRIVDNACARAGRSARASSLVLKLDSDPEVDAVSPSRLMRRDERFERLRRAIEALPDKYREAVQLARIDGLKIAEVAMRIGKSEESVRQLIARGLRKIRKSFGDTRSLTLPPRQLARESSEAVGEPPRGDNHEGA